ncbi:cop9 signalosome complex subunit, partial [Nowakowskiella sp. JEL0078]
METPKESAEKDQKPVKFSLVKSYALDLASFDSKYDGHVKVNKLLFIAEVCPNLQEQALAMAFDEIKATSLDLKKYSTVFDKLSTLNPEVRFDSVWLDNTAKSIREKSEKLEQDLKLHRTNTMKENCRITCVELGNHYYECGDLSKSLKYYTQSRDFSSSSKHLVEMCLNVIKVSIELGNFTHAQSFIVKAESITDIPDRAIVQSKLKCALGLVNLVESGKFARAAKSFLEISFDIGSSYNDVVSPHDVAIYGGLCALAAFDRQDLKSKVFENSDFKQFLDLEPQIRDLLQNFYNSKYTVCLELLDRMKPDLLLDMYLHTHVEQIYQTIRKKALVQYFSPFKSVDMKKMAAAFNTTVEILEPEVAKLIADRELQARIDSHNKVLQVKQVEQRSKIFKDSLDLAKDYSIMTKHTLVRMKLLTAGLVAIFPPAPKKWRMQELTSIGIAFMIAITGITFVEFFKYARKSHKNLYFRKIDVYTMSWKDIDLSKFMVAAAPFGGPI